LRPLGEMAVGSAADAVFCAITDGICCGRAVRLEFRCSRSGEQLPPVVLKPELLVPYHRHWYLIGSRPVRGRNRLVSIELEQVRSASLEQTLQSQAS
jgi:hypothetical protein